MPDVTVFMTFLVLHAALNGHVVAEHLPNGLAEGLRPVNHEEEPLLDVEPAVDQVGEQRGHDRRVLGRPVPQAERELVTFGGDPERDDVRAAVQLDPVEHDHRQSHVHERAVHQVPQRSRVRCTNVRDTADFDVDRASVSTSLPTGSCARRYWRVETPASIRSSTTSPS